MYGASMSESASRTFSVAQSLDLSFDPNEDRLLLVGHTAEHGLRSMWLTRRLTRGLVVHFSRLLRSTSEEAAMAPEGYANEILRMEHIQALESGFETPADIPAHAEGHDEDGVSQGEDSGAEQTDRVFFALEVTFQQREESLFLGFSGKPFTDGGSNVTGEPEAIFALLLERPHAHKMLAAVCGKIREADWGEDVRPEWLQTSGLESCEHLACQ